jgi:hypothetical protein
MYADLTMSLKRKPSESVEIIDLLSDSDDEQNSTTAAAATAVYTQSSRHLLSTKTQKRVCVDSLQSKTESSRLSTGRPAGSHNLQLNDRPGSGASASPSVPVPHYGVAQYHRAINESKRAVLASKDSSTANAMDTALVASLARANAKPNTFNANRTPASSLTGLDVPMTPARPALVAATHAFHSPQPNVSFRTSSSARPHRPPTSAASSRRHSLPGPSFTSGSAAAATATTTLASSSSSASSSSVLPGIESSEFEQLFKLLPTEFVQESPWKT